MKTNHYFSELYCLLLPLFFGPILIGQSPQIEAVENNLLPNVVLTGQSPWNIYDRMAHYDVQGVSIAVIDNFEIQWAKGYGVSDAKKIEIKDHNFQTKKIESC